MLKVESSPAAVRAEHLHKVLEVKFLTEDTYRIRAILDQPQHAPLRLAERNS